MAEQLELAQLIVRLGIAEGDIDRMESRLDEVNVSLQRAGTQAGQTFGQGMRVPLLQAYWDIQALIGGAQQLTQVLGEVSGVSFAAQYQQMTISLQTLTGSKKAADDLLDSLQKMGSETPFDTAQLVGYTRLLLSTGANAKSVTSELGTMADAIAALGLDTGAVGRLAINLSQIRAGKATAADYKQFATLGLDLDKIVGAALGRTLATGGGAQALRAMTGDKQYQTILSGLRGLYGGAAERAGGGFLGTLQNLGETLRNIMLPTGNLLLPTLTRLLGLFKWVGGEIQALNKVTGGGAGLIALTIGLVAAQRLLVGSALSAIQTINGLTASLTRLADTSHAAAVASTGAAVSGAANVAEAAGGGAAAAAAASRGPRALAWFRGLPAALREGTLLRGIVPALRTALTATRIANIGGLIASLGLGFLGDHIGGKAGNILSNAGTGLGLGTLLGMKLGLPGTLIGGGIGAILGGLYGNSLPVIPAQKAATDKQADALNQNTDALKQLRGSLIGGGERGHRITSQLQMEYAVAALMARGVA